MSLGGVVGFVTLHTLIALHTPAHVDFFTRRRVRVRLSAHMLRTSSSTYARCDIALCMAMQPRPACTDTNYRQHG